MTSSVASDEKARNATSDRARRNMRGGKPLVLDCTSATFNKEMIKRFDTDGRVSSQAATTE